jgi:hypothetical protein
MELKETREVSTTSREAKPQREKKGFAMEILAQATAAKPTNMTFLEVCFLQSPEEIREMDGMLEDYEPDSFVLDLLISEYDYTAEQHWQKPMTIGQFWLPSFVSATETITYLIVRDVFGNYAIYKKAWL